MLLYVDYCSYIWQCVYCQLVSIFQIFKKWESVSSIIYFMELLYLFKDCKTQFLMLVKVTDKKKYSLVEIYFLA